MRRMEPDPGRLIECKHENSGRETIIYVPIKDRSELHVTFDLIIPNGAIIIPILAYYSYINGEVYGGGDGLNSEGNAIDVTCDVDSLDSYNPFLKLRMNYVRGDLSGNVTADDDKVFIRNIVHLSKIPLDSLTYTGN